MSIEIRLMTAADELTAVDFVERKIGVDGTPLITHLQLSENERGLIAQLMISDGLANDRFCSYVAIDTTTKSVVGCVILAISDRWASNLETGSIDYRLSTNLQSLSDFNRLMFSGVDEFLPFPYAGPWINFVLGLVEPSYRRLGLMQRMMDVGLERAYSVFGCRYAIGHFTSFKSQRYGEKTGWITVRWINYRDFFVIGKRIFDFHSDPDQSRSQVMILDIRDWKERKD